MPMSSWLNSNIQPSTPPTVLRSYMSHTFRFPSYERLRHIPRTHSYTPHSALSVNVCVILYLYPPRTSCMYSTLVDMFMQNIPSQVYILQVTQEVELETGGYHGFVVDI